MKLENIVDGPNGIFVVPARNGVGQEVLCLVATPSGVENRYFDFASFFTASIDGDAPMGPEIALSGAKMATNVMAFATYLNGNLSGLTAFVVALEARVAALET